MSNEKNPIDEFQASLSNIGDNINYVITTLGIKQDVLSDASKLYDGKGISQKGVSNLKNAPSNKPTLHSICCIGFAISQLLNVDVTIHDLLSKNGIKKKHNGSSIFEQSMRESIKLLTQASRLDELQINKFIDGVEILGIKNLTDVQETLITSDGVEGITKILEIVSSNKRTA